MTHPDLVAAVIVGLLTAIGYGLLMVDRRLEEIQKLLTVANRQRERDSDV